MAKLLPSSLLLAAFLLSLVTLSPTPAASDAGSELPLGWITSLRGCRGTIAECLAGEEFDLGSESSRRMLATSDYISYGALKRDVTPCSRRGASYYNCRPGAEANPYSRGCSDIAQCRGG